MKDMPQKHSFEFTGWHMLVCMVAFFGVIIAVNLTMAYRASNSWTGLLVKNTYVASQQYNDTLHIAQKQRDRGLNSQMRYNEGMLEFTVLDGNKTKLKLEQARLSVGRPATETHDAAHEPLCDKKLNCQVLLNLKPGQWIASLQGLLEEQPYRRDFRLLVSENGTALIE